MNRSHKTLLILAAVLGPVLWLLFTSDGRRRSDLALMSLHGRPAFDAALDAFSDRLTETRLRETFPALDLHCGEARTPLGDRRCTAAIGSFNQYPARALSLYFQGGRLTAAKVVYQGAYHDQIRAWLQSRARLTTAAPAPREGVRALPVSGGVLLIKDGPLTAGDEPALLWLAPAAHARSGPN